MAGLANSEAVVAGLLRGIVSADAGERERAADEVCDVVMSLGETAPAVSWALVVARSVENSMAAQEAQLHALAEVHELVGVPIEVLEVVRRRGRSWRGGSQDEYVAFLTEG